MMMELIYDIYKAQDKFPSYLTLGQSNILQTFVLI